MGCSFSKSSNNATFFDLTRGYLVDYFTCNLKQLIDDLTNGQCEFLGCGSFGHVIKQLVPCPPNLAAAAEAAGHVDYVCKGIPVIVKFIFHSDSTPLAACEAEAAACIATSSSKHLPRLYHHLHRSGYSVLVFEAVSSSPQNLAQRVHACATAVGGPQHLSLPEMLETMTHVANGVQDMHDRGWCHLVVKAPNIVLGEQHSAYLVDLGLARKLGVGLKQHCPGTQGYRDPLIMWEALKGEDLKVQPFLDWWSAGMVLVFMLVRGNRNRFDRVARLAASYSIFSREYMRLELVRKVLQPEVSAVVGAYEEQQQQQGLLQQGVELVGVREGVMDMVEGLLQRRPKHRWSSREVCNMVEQVAGLMGAATTLQQ
jgi:serine/threonine protein kinase